MKQANVVETEEPELTTKEIAAKLRVDPGTVRTWRSCGMPGRKIGYRRILFKLSECNRWLEEHEAEKEKERQARAREREGGARKKKVK